MMDLFTPDKEYSREEISAKIGGSIRQYLPTKNKEVICVCIKKEMNLPPDRILVGVKPRTIETADILTAQGKRGESVPLFERRGSARWQYRGKYRAVSYVLAKDQPDLVENYRQQAGRKSPVTGVIRLKRISD